MKRAIQHGWAFAAYKDEVANYDSGIAKELLH